MTDTPRTSPGEVPKSHENPPIASLSRAAVAEKLRISEQELPDGEFFTAVNGSIDDLSKRMSEMKWEARRQELMTRLQSISAKEAKDKASETAWAALDAMKNNPTVAALAWSLSWLPTSPEAAFNTLAQKWWEKAAWVVDAIATGDLKTAAKEASGLSDSIAGAVKGITDGIGNVFVKILEWLSWFWSLITGAGDAREKFDKLNGVDDAKKKAWEVADDAKKKAEELAEWAKKTASEMTPEKAREIIAGKYWDRLVKSGYITNPEKQKKDFFEAFEKYQKWGFVANLVDIAKKAESDPNWNIGDNIFRWLDTQRKFIYELIERWVIPVSAIGAQIVDAAKWSVRLYLNSPWILIDKWSTGFLTELAHINWFDGGMSEADKRTTLAILHHNMTLPLYITGLATSAIARIGLVGAYWDQWTWLTQAKVGYDAITGDFTKATKQMDDLMKMLGADEKNLQMSQGVKEHISETRMLIEESQMRARVTQEYLVLKKSGAKNIDIAAKLESVLGEFKNVHPTSLSIGNSLLQDLRTNVNALAGEAQIKNFIAKSPEVTSMNWWNKAGNELKWATYATREMENLSYLRYKSWKELEGSAKVLGSIVEHGAPRAWNNLRFAWQTINLLEAAEKWHLALKVQNAADAKWILEQIARALPEGFKHFFSSVAVTVAIADVASQQGTSDTLESVAKNLLSLSPLYGGWIMIYEWLTMDHSTPIKPAFLIMWSWVFALGMKDVVSLVSRPSWAAFSRVAFSPLYTVAQAGWAAMRWSRLAYEAVRFGLRPGALAPFIRLRALAGYGVAIWAGWYLYESLVADKTKKTMQEAGFFESDGSLVSGKKLTDAWSKIGEWNRSKILDEVLTWVFQQSGITTTVKSDNSVVMHSEVSGREGTPITLDSFEAIRTIFKDLGVTNPQVFMSEPTTKAVKEKIESFALDVETKKKMLADFGIKA